MEYFFKSWYNKDFFFNFTNGNGKKNICINILQCFLYKYISKVLNFHSNNKFQELFEPNEDLTMQAAITYSIPDRCVTKIEHLDKLNTIIWDPIFKTYIFIILLDFNFKNYEKINASKLLL